MEIISPKSIDKDYPNYIEDKNDIEIDNDKVISVLNKINDQVCI